MERARITWPTDVEKDERSVCEMPSARIEAFFAYFLLPLRQKVRRLSGRVPTVQLKLFLL